MHITILALGSRGDIQPYAVLGSGLKKKGHQVRFITLENFSDLIADCGLDFHSLPGDAQSLVASAGPNMTALIRSFGSLAKSYPADLSDPLLGETELIINQLPGGLFGYDLAEKYRLPMVLAAVIPLARTKTFPLMGFPSLPWESYNNWTYSVGEYALWLLFRRTINRKWRKKNLNLPPVSKSTYFNSIGTNQIPIINGFSPAVVSRPEDWGENIHLTGYWYPDEKTWYPPPELLAFLESGHPPVFIGFGSMPVKNPSKTTRIILDALQQTGQRGILHAGRGDLGKQSLPDHVYKIDYAPYNWLFPRMGMVIHHGGSGATAFSLRAGVPSCAIPFVFDQYFWGNRIADMEAGPKPLRFRDLTADRLAQVIQLGTSSTRIRKSAAAIGAKIRKEDGIKNAITVIEGLYAARS